MRNWRALVFDLDDTLYLERDYVLSGMRAVSDWAEVALHLPASHSFHELTQLFAEGVRGDTFDRWLSSHGLEPAGLVPTVVKVYRSHLPQIAPLPGLEGLLRNLASRCLIGLVTDGYFEVQQRKFAALRLQVPFQAVVYSDLIGRAAWKPSPRPFQLALQRLGVSAEETVYVGDNPVKDFRGARPLGIRTIRLRHPGGLYRHLEPATVQDAPDAEITQLDDLSAALAILPEQPGPVPHRQAA